MGWTHDKRATLYSGGGSVVLTVDGRSDSFTGSSSFTATEGSGATLTLSGGVYTYASGDGMIATFNSNSAYYSAEGERPTALVSSITYPDGSQLSFTYFGKTYCRGGYENNRCQTPLEISAAPCLGHEQCRVQAPVHLCCREPSSADLGQYLRVVPGRIGQGPQ